MHDIETTLSEKPVIGILCTVLGYAISYMEHLSPILRFTALCLGVIAGLLTVIVKVFDLADKIKGREKKT